MPTNFLDLPREIRDEIYSLLLISPHNVIQPRIRCRFPPHVELSARRVPTKTSEWSLLLDSVRGHKLHVSVIRTCRQIYHETHGLFWESNKFFFPNYSLYDRGLVDTVKLMGQVASRLITRVCILMRPRSTGGRGGGGPSYSGLAKALQTLASRARHGSLREIELVWDRWALDRGVRATSGHLAYEKLLSILRNASENCERTIRLPPLSIINITLGIDPDSLSPRDLHHAFGGRLFVGEILVWDNFKEISKIDNMLKIK